MGQVTVNRAGGRRPKKDTLSLVVRLVGMVAAVVVIAWAIRRPDYLKRGVEILASPARVLNPKQMDAVSGSYSSGFMQVVATPGGDVLLVDKEQVLRCVGGDPKTAETVLKRSDLRDLFGEERIQSFSSALQTADGTIWVGTWKGQLLSKRGEAWKLGVSAEDGPTGKIEVMRECRGELYAAAGELWRIEASSTGWQIEALPQFEGQRVTCLALEADGDLLAGSDLGVFRLTKAGVWNMVYEATADDKGGVQALAVAPDKRILAGTGNGLLLITEEGIETGRELAGNAIDVVAAAPDGTLFAGAYKMGVHMGTQGSWQHVELPPNLQGVLVYPADRLWIALYEQDALTAPLSRFTATVESDAK